MAQKIGPGVRAYAGAACPWCQWSLGLAGVKNGRQECGHCHREFEARVFEPPRRIVRVAEIGVLSEGSATPCANHAGNAAVSSCSRCGVFVCSLCDTEADGMHLCPACFERLASEGTLESARTTFRDYGGLTQTACVVGFVICYLAPIAMPLTLYYGRKALREKAERGETEGRAGIIAAMVLSSLELVGAVVAIALVAFSAAGK